MARGSGLPRVDVDCGIAEDPKFRRLARAHSDLAASAFTAYVALLGASWRAGERVAIADAWPSWLPENADVVAALSAELIDAEGRIVEHAWDSWYGEAAGRVEKLRAGWRERQARRREAQPEREGSALQERDRTEAVPLRTDESRVTSAPPESHAGVTRDVETAASPAGAESTAKTPRKVTKAKAVPPPLAPSGETPTVSTSWCRSPREHRQAHVLADGSWYCQTCGLMSRAVAS